MGKPVELTWRDGDGNVFIEKCRLVSEDQPIYQRLPDGSVIESDHDSFWEEVRSRNMVAFENVENIFLLPANLIVQIDDDEES